MQEKQFWRPAFYITFTWLLLVIVRQCVIFSVEDVCSWGWVIYNNKTLHICRYLHSKQIIWSWWCLVGNVGIMNIANFLIWLVGICSLLPVNILAYWCWSLLTSDRRHFQMCLKEVRGWHHRERTFLSLPQPPWLYDILSLFLFSHNVPIKVIVSLVLAHFIWALLASSDSHSVAAFHRAKFGGKWYLPLSFCTFEWKHNLWQCSVLYEDQC